MKTLLSLVALAIVPLSLSAQTKPTQARKPATTAVRPAASTKSNTPVRSTAAVRQTTPVKPAGSINAAPAQPAVAQATTPAPVVEEKPTVVAVAAPTPKAQTQTASLPATKPASAKPSRFRIGFRVGAHSSTFGGMSTGDLGGDVKLEPVSGFHGGLVMNIGGRVFSVQPEILYTQYGFRFAAGSDYLQLKYNHVEVPVLLKGSFGGSGFRFFINAGPVVSYALNGTLSMAEGGELASQAINMTNEGRLAYGAAAGLGASFKAGPGSVLAEARYTYLMSGTTSDGSTVAPQSAMLSVGYLIPLGR